MELDAPELAERLHLAAAKDTVRGVMFNAVMQPVARRYGAADLRALHERLAPADWSALRMYPVADFLKLLFEVVEVGVRRGEARADALRWAGAGCSEVFLASPVGKALLALFARLGTMAFFRQVGPAYRLMATYGTREFELLGPNEGVVHFRNELCPPLFHEGVFLAGLQAVKLRGSIEARMLSAVDFDLVGRWS
jgi:uncharacterized protein (TIGR02265 family)